MQLLIITVYRKNNENLKIMRIKGTPDSCKLTLKDEWFIICNICVIICGYFGFSQHAVIQRGY